MKNKTFYPSCRFCGAQTLPFANYPTQAAADEAATITCQCTKAKEYQQELERKKERENNINKLNERIDDFATYCENRGVELTDELHHIFVSAGIAVLDGIIGSATFKLYKLKVNISTNSKSNIVIGFTYSDGAKVEV